MFERIKDYFSFILQDRLRVAKFVFTVFAIILISRLFVLQIIKGKNYQENYDLKVAKTETVAASRGNIYDRDGQLLAYNDLVYSVTIEDTGSYKNSSDKNEKLNHEIAQIIKNIEKRGDAINNSFGISYTSNGSYEFNVSGTSLQRFRADIFGYGSINDLKYNDKLKVDEATASASEIMAYLTGENRYNIDEKYGKELQYKIAIVRYNISQNNYQKYIATVIASNVSDETVAYIKENQNELVGVEITEESYRRYVDSECFSNIIGYTGQISVDEYNARVEAGDEDVKLTDVIGKSGIEQLLDTELSGQKGYQTLYVDSVGNTLDVSDYTDSVPGNDVYLSIQKDLQVAAYNLLEQEIAGIVYSKIENIKTYSSSENSSASDIVIPIYDVYYAFINNNLINVSEFASEDASATEKFVLATYKNKKANVLSTLKQQLNASRPTVYNQLPKEYQAYSTYIVTYLKSTGIFDSSAIDSSDEMQQKWTSEELSVNEYLTYAIEKDWIDITKFEASGKFATSDELYKDLVKYVLEVFENESGFEKIIYKYLILEDGITGNQLCAILYDQGVLEYDESAYNSLIAGQTSAFNFVKTKLKKLEITPGQLGLDPCSGSTVVIDVNTGEVLACVSYPGYDNNKLANNVDSKYYKYLNSSSSTPLYNHATQQRTAPGSTFKIVSSVAGLAENEITTSEKILDAGVYEKVDNHPRCWSYPNSHGFINVSEAIRDSCNYFYYEVGYRLAGGERGNYSDKSGIKKITKYASLFGLNEKTGIELEESEPHIATEYPVMAAIGQSDNNYTTISLARYAAAIANSGTVYNLTLLDKTQDIDGNVLTDYSPSVRNKIDVLNAGEWSAIHSGMRMVVENLSSFNGMSVAVAGKTGTAQQVRNRPNHALFIGYAPYSNPQIAIATRIAYGYTSHNSADVSGQILSYYFGDTTVDEIINGTANDINSAGNSFTD